MNYAFPYANAAKSKMELQAGDEEVPEGMLRSLEASTSLMIWRMAALRLSLMICSRVSAPASANIL